MNLVRLEKKAASEAWKRGCIINGYTARVEEDPDSKGNGDLENVSDARCLGRGPHMAMVSRKSRSGEPCLGSVIALKNAQVSAAAGAPAVGHISGWSGAPECGFFGCTRTAFRSVLRVHLRCNPYWAPTLVSDRAFGCVHSGLSMCFGMHLDCN